MPSDWVDNTAEKHTVATPNQNSRRRVVKCERSLAGSYARRMGRHVVVGKATLALRAAISRLYYHIPNLCTPFYSSRKYDGATLTINAPPCLVRKRFIATKVCIKDALYEGVLCGSYRQKAKTLG